MRRVETDEIYFGEVALDLFRGEIFKRQLYLDRAVEIVLDGVRALNISKKEPIHICRGYILSKAREKILKEGFKAISTKIRGETQALAEEEFIKSLSRMGVGDKKTIVEMRSFEAFLRWVMEDIERRERFVKTGWHAWPHLKKGRKRLES
jgi:hypothetical protein